MWPPINIDNEKHKWNKTNLFVSPTHHHYSDNQQSIQAPSLMMKSMKNQTKHCNIMWVPNMYHLNLFSTCAPAAMIIVMNTNLSEREEVTHATTNIIARWETLTSHDSRLEGKQLNVHRPNYITENHLSFFFFLLKRVFFLNSKCLYFFGSMPLKFEQSMN